MLCNTGYPGIQRDARTTSAPEFYLNDQRSSEQTELQSAGTHLDNTALSFDGSVRDLAVIDNDGIATRSPGSRVGPANALGESSVGVGKEQL